MFQSFITPIARHLRLNEKEVNSFTGKLKVKHVKPKSYLLREGEVCRFQGYINKGCLRVFFVNEAGHETILYFAVEDWWITDLDSFSSGKPSRMNIQALEDTEVLLISKKDKDDLFSHFPRTERLLRLMTQKAHTALQKRIISIYNKTVDEKYMEFKSMYKDIEFRLPQKQLAAYLGITTEFLAQMRRRNLVASVG